MREALQTEKRLKGLEEMVFAEIETSELKVFEILAYPSPEGNGRYYYDLDGIRLVFDEDGFIGWYKPAPDPDEKH